VDTVRDASGTVDLVVLEQVAAGNVPLLVQSNVCVGRLVDAAKSAGAPTNGLVVDTAGRQRMLIQRMCKEAFLIASGVSVSTNVNNLKGTILLFQSSHDGIILGAPWAGVPTLTKMCTLHQMSQVTYTFGLFSPLINEILNALTVAESLTIANRLAADIAARSGPLFGAMVAAVSLYVNDPGTCTPMDSMSSDMWKTHILNTGNVVSSSQFAVATFLQIANNVAVQASVVSLIVELNTIDALIKNLIQGNLADDIDAPPTQGMVDLLVSAQAAWSELEAELTKAVTGHAITLVTITKVSQLTEEFQTSMTAAKDLVVALSLPVAPNIPAYAIQVAATQLTRLAKLNMLINLVVAGESVESNRILYNTTRDEFLAGHIFIITGVSPEEGAEDLPKLTTVCAIQHMLKIYRGFKAIDVQAQSAMAGSSSSLESLAQSTEVTRTEMAYVSDYYAGNGTFPCSNKTLTYDEWIDVIKAVGVLRAFSQEASTIYLTASSAGGNAEANRVDIARQRVLDLMRDVAFGSELLPAPSTQTALDQVINDVEPPVEDFAVKLEGGISSSMVINSGLIVMEVVDDLQKFYMDEAILAFPRIPVRRINAGSYLMMLAQKATKEAIMFIYAVTGSNVAVFDTGADFEALLANIRDGGNGLPEISPQRPDLSGQVDIVESTWLRLKNWLENAGANDVPEMETELANLLVELNTLQDLFLIVDEEEAEVFPWMFVAYGAMGFFLMSCACGAIYVHWIGRRKSNTNQGNNQWPGAQA